MTESANEAAEKQAARRTDLKKTLQVWRKSDVLLEANQHLLAITENKLLNKQDSFDIMMSALHENKDEIKVLSSTLETFTLKKQGLCQILKIALESLNDWILSDPKMVEYIQENYK